MALNQSMALPCLHILCEAKNIHLLIFLTCFMIKLNLKVFLQGKNYDLACLT